MLALKYKNLLGQNNWCSKSASYSHSSTKDETCVANDGRVGSSLSMCTALKHTHLPVDIVIEEDSVAGRLSYYDALYVAVRQCL